MLPAEINLRLIAGQQFYHRFSFLYPDGSVVPVASLAQTVRYVIRPYPWPGVAAPPIFAAQEGAATWQYITIRNTLPNIEVRIPAVVTELWLPGVYVHELDYLSSVSPEVADKVCRGAVAIHPSFMETAA
jgi:hypothetical protein